MDEVIITEPLAGIFQVSLPYPPIGTVNIYMAPDSTGLTFIDTGPGGAEYQSLMEELLDQPWVKRMGKVHTICLTHAHHDHMGQAAFLQRREQSICYLDETELNEFHGRDEVSRSDKYMGWLHQHGLPPHEEPAIRQRISAPPPMPNTHPYGTHIQIGGMDWEVIHTPGHASGHQVFYQPQKRWLFGGDHFLPGSTPSLAVRSPSSAPALRLYRQSIQKLRLLPVEWVLPGHGEPYQGFRERVEGLDRHHGDRIAQVKGVCHQEWLTAYEICRLIWTVPGAFILRTALGQTVGYLTYLEAEGFVERREENGQLRWRQVGE